MVSEASTSKVIVRQGLDKDLHASAQAQHQVKGGLLLDVVIRQCASIFKLLSSEDEALLVWRDALLVLNLCLDIVNGVGSFDVQGNGLAREGLDEDLHASAQAQHQVKGGLLLDVVIRKGATLLQLLSGKNEALLIWRDALLVLDLGLDVVNCVGGLDIQSDCLACQRLDKDLHASTQAQHQVQRGLFLDVVIRQCAAVLQLFAGKDKALLVRRDALLVLDLGFDIVDGVRGLDVKSDGLASQSLDKDLHTTTEPQHQVQRGLFLDVVIRQRAAVLQLFAGKDKALLVWRDALFVLDLSLDIINGVRSFHIQGDGFAS